MSTTVRSLAREAEVRTERAARDWHSRESGALELASICRSAVIGPVLGGTFSTWLNIVTKLIGGSLPGLPHFGCGRLTARSVLFSNSVQVKRSILGMASAAALINLWPFFLLMWVAIFYLIWKDTRTR